MATNYSDLQEKAKELGIPYAGVSKKDLKKAIEAKESKNPDALVEEPTVTDPPKAKKEPKVSKKEEEPTGELNAAIVYDESREVRRYTIESHGEAFLDLANQFAEKHGYTVEAMKLKPGVKCPSCGFEFHPLA